MPSPVMSDGAVSHSTAVVEAARRNAHRSASAYAFTLVLNAPGLPRNERAVLLAMGAHADVMLLSPNGYSGTTAGDLSAILNVSPSTALGVLRALVKVGAVEWSQLPARYGHRPARIPQDVFDLMAA